MANPWRYRVSNAKTAGIKDAHFPTMQQAGDYLFNFRNDVDFGNYVLHDAESGAFYDVKNSDSINAIEFIKVKDI